jgi:toxin-antitoxin system PIN domain toxin
MLAFDTNIAVYAANVRDPRHTAARHFLEQIKTSPDVVVCELMLVELFLKLCNARIFANPWPPAEAAELCHAYRNNRLWKRVDSAPVMEEVWKWTRKPDFAFRRIIDVRLALTLRHHGVTEFATSNLKDFQDLGFTRVWNPVEIP